MTTTNDDRLYAMLLYVLSFPLTVLGPLLIWLLKREDSPFVDHHGKQYFNFVVSYFIYSVVGAILIFVVIGFVVLFALWIMMIVYTIIAAIKAYQGEWYKFPLVIEFLK